MNHSTTNPAPAGFNSWRLLGWGTIIGLIMMPAIAMRFTTEVNWGAEDFVFATVMLGGLGFAFEMAVRASGSWAYRGGTAVALGAGLLMLWANGAVGIVGNEENDINIWFNLIPLLALFGTVGARFRAPGMVVAMLATAIAQVLIGLIVQFYGFDIWIFTAIWTAAWLLAAWLFRRAAVETAA